MTASILMVVTLMLPVTGILLMFLVGGRAARGIALWTGVGGLTASIGIACKVWEAGKALTYASGGWMPPLGIQFRADGLTAVMLITAAIVILSIVVYAPESFRVRGKCIETRRSLVFWILLMAVWAAMNAIFMGNDYFNLYVALELVTFAAVPLVCMSGSRATLEAALRYLLFALTGSALYLLGVALLYGAYGTLDITHLAGLVRSEPALWLAVALMTVGLAAKTALFPLHLWLPPAHSGAPPAASALLSALVVKGSFFITVRLWFDTIMGIAGDMAPQLLGVMGTGAIVAGGVMALRQNRLKLLIAYSTVAQIGYLFLMFPMAAQATALAGGMYQAMSHAFAKAAMFMAAGLMAETAGSDKLDELRGIGKALPLTTAAFGLAALSLVGVPPTGGFMTKWLLLAASFASGQWWWVVVVFCGGLLAGGYMFRALKPVMSAGDQARASVSRMREYAVVVLALCALLLGTFPKMPIALIEIGRPEIAEKTP